MNSTKTNKPSLIKFGIYHLDHNYVNALRKSDNRIINPKDHDLYCGPIVTHECERGLISYFVPVDPSVYDEYDVLPMTLFLGKLGGDFLDFNKMIPVVNERFLSPETTREDILAYITKIKNRMEECADYIIGVQRGEIDPHSVDINANSFLEEKMRAYDAMKKNKS